MNGLFSRIAKERLNTTAFVCYANGSVSKVFGVNLSVADYSKESESEEKRMLYDSQRETIQGYEIRESVRIDGKDYVLAENPNAVQPYVTWQRRENDIMASYENGHYYGNFLEAMIDFTERIRQDAQYLLDYYKEHGIEVVPFSEDVCIKGSKQKDYKGQFVVIKASALAPEFRARENQIYKALDGNGCSPAALGTKVYCMSIFNGEEERWRREDIAGIVDPAKLPEKFRERMALMETRSKESDLAR